MGGKRSITNYALITLGGVFAFCLIMIIVVNNRTQTRIFWENQQEKLALIAEKCKVELSDWVGLHIKILDNVTTRIISGDITSREGLLRFLTETTETNKEIQTAYLCLDSHASYFIDWAPPDDYDPTARAWYKEGRAGGGAAVFTEPYIDLITGKTVISCVKALRLSDGQDGVVSTDVSIEFLKMKIFGFKNSKNGAVHLLSADGRVMSSTDSGLLTTRPESNGELLKKTTVFDKITVLETNEHFLDRGIELLNIIDYDGDHKYLAKATIPKTGWQLYMSIPLADYDIEVSKVIQDQIPIIIIAISMSIISIIFALSMIMFNRNRNKLQRKIEVAEAATRTKSDFLSRMSHEMRTPMNAIIGMTKIAESSQDIDKLKYCLKTIGDSSSHLLGIINDVLDMSKIEAGKFDLDCTPTDIEKMLIRICGLITEKTEQKRQKLLVNISPALTDQYFVDELRLSQVITNLLSNAVKFTPECGTIMITVKDSKLDDDTGLLYFEVKDTGIGIDDEQSSRLFNSFEQADGSISRRFGGTGLGLSISSSIIEKMGGEIRVESKLGSGSKFSFEIELIRAGNQTERKLMEGFDSSRVKVLLVGGDQTNAEWLKSVFDHYNFYSAMAPNISASIETVEREKAMGVRFTTVLIDAGLLIDGGVEQVRALKSAADGACLILMASFSEWSELESDARECGINVCLTRPVFPSELIEAIGDSLNSADKRHEYELEPVSDLPDFSGINLLLAEDIEINREIFKALLEDTNICIDTAENGAEAVAIFTENPDKYDIIIMDIQMPEMDGITATKAIRALDFDRAKSVPIVAMTANAFKEDVEKCVEAGMNDHLSKPIDEKMVMEKIEKYTAK